MVVLRILCGLLVGVLAGNASAQDARDPAASRPAPRYSLKIPRISLEAAIQSLDAQTELTIAFMRGHRTEGNLLVGPLYGEYTIEAALDTLLERTTLVYQRLDAHTIAVHPRGDGVGAGELTPLLASEPERLESFDDRLLEAAAPPLAAMHPDSLEVVLVTGSRIGWSIEVPPPVMVMSRLDIEAYGDASVADVLKNVSQQPYSRGAGYFPSGAQAVDLRGVGVDSTLVLINGRRTQPSANVLALDFFDLNTVPTAAVDRIEVLSDSASAIYGGDAVGGVVNILLRKSLERPIAEVRYGFADGGGEERRATFGIGANGERAHGALVVEMLEREFLLGEKRSRWRDQDFRRYGGADQRLTTTHPGNVYSGTPDPLPGLSTAMAGVPAGSAATTPADFLATAGMANADSLYRYVSILPEAQRFAVSGFGELDLDGGATLHAELLYTDRRSAYQEPPPRLSFALVPATNPYNPFRVPVFVEYLFEDLPPVSWQYESQLLRGVLGASGRLGRWSWDTSIVRSEEDGSALERNDLDPGRVADALASSDPATALNVFTGGPAGHPELLHSLLAGAQPMQSRSCGTMVNAYLRGPMLDLPAGSVDLVLGGERRREHISYNEQMSVDRDRQVNSGFAELNVPLVGPARQVPGVRSLSLSLAARYDEYNDFGGTFNPQYGVTWKPLSAWTLRASYGTSFRPPSLIELFAPTLSHTLPQADVRRGELYPMQVMSGGNEDLDPIEADHLNLGLIYQPSSQLRTGATFWRVHLAQRVTLLSPQLLLVNEALYPERVLRDAPTAADLAAGRPGRVRALDVRRVNFGSIDTRGVDFNFDHTLDTRYGSFNTRLLGTWIDRYRSIDLPGTPSMDRRGLAHMSGTIPDWRASATLTWRHRTLAAATTVRYLASYRDSYLNRPTSRVVPAKATLDLQMSFDPSALVEPGSWAHGLRLCLGMSNALDDQPPFSEVAALAGFDTSQDDLTGRYTYVKLSKRF